MAITREVSPAIGACELTYLARQPINPCQARIQHRRYEDCLASLGCSVLRLPASSDLPDSVFVEDTAVVLEETAIITRPGAESRRPETQAVAAALAPYRQLAFLKGPAVLDGGDVLRLGKRLFVGMSRRSNREAVIQMRDLLDGFGYSVTGVEVKACLHLKSAVTRVAEDMLLVNRSWVDPAPFGAARLLEVAPDEPGAANALLLEGTVIFPESYPETAQRIEACGIAVRRLPLSELAKAEGGVTCCSLIFEAQE